MAVMEGRVRAAEREMERAVIQAWHTANLSRPKNLPDLGKYLAKLKPEKAQTADEVAGVFLSLKAKGKSVKIRERKRA